MTTLSTQQRALLTDREEEFLSFLPQRRALILRNSISANSGATLVSQQLPFSALIRRMTFYVLPGAEGYVTITVKVANDPSSPTSEPAGQNILQGLGEDDTLVLMDRTTTFEHMYHSQEPAQWLKIFASNGDNSNDHLVQAIVEIDDLGLG